MKLKICCACEQPSVIWKNDGGNRYCRNCWYKKNPVKIAKKSEKQKVKDESYKLINKAYLIKNPICAAKLPGCLGKSSQVHHKKGRIGDLLIDTKYFLAVCMHCHQVIENNPELAKKLNLSESRL